MKTVQQAMCPGQNGSRRPPTSEKPRDWYYTRLGAERYDFGTWMGTWWDKGKPTWPASGS